MSATRDIQGLISGLVSDDPALLAAVSTDYGGIVHATPRLVVRPTSASEVAAVLRYAYERELPVTARGGGKSFGGQALSTGGIILDMTLLDHIGELEPGGEHHDAQLTTGAGALWKDVVCASAPHGYLPPVLTTYLGTSVGGTLSAGGFGMSSARYGAQIDHCVELELALPTGELIRCSEREERALFELALGGFGQFGVITRATFGLRRAKPLCRTYFLLYDDLEAHLADHVRLAEADEVSFIDAMVQPCYHGLKMVDGQRRPLHSYLYPMNITVEAERAEDFDDEGLLRELNCSKWVYAEDLSAADFLLVGHTEEVASDKIAEVFVDVLIPWSQVHTFIRKLEAHILPRIVHVEHTILWPLRRKLLTRPLLACPDEDMFMGIGLYPRVPKAAAAQTVAAAQAFVDLALAAGGHYYLTGSVRLDAARYAQQFGPRWPTIIEAKRRYDPKHLLNRGFFTWT